jgi:magnesium chelatase accessory protein
VSRAEWEREGRDWPNRAASRFVDAGGIRWHVQISGSGPVLLLLHGTGAATHSWRDLLPMLAADFTVVAPDLPGHGFSRVKSSRSLTLPAMAEGVGALRETLSLSPDLIVGHSAGAAIGARMVLDANVKPKALISINGALLPFPGLAAKIFPAMAQMLFINPFVPRIFALQARLSGEVGSFLKRSTGSDIDTAGVDYYARLFATSDHCGAALGMMANWDLASLKAGLPSLGVPLTLIYGDKDVAVPATVAQGVAALVPGAQAVALPGLGHLAHEERPGEVADIIRAVFGDS